MSEEKATAELTLDEAIKAAKDWQDNAEMAIPYEIVTGLVDGADALLAEVAQLREALEPFTNNGRVFIFHRNIEEGDYFECLFCNGEGKQWKTVTHKATCLVVVARAALASEFALQVAERHLKTTKTVGAQRLADNVDAELQEVRAVLSLTADRRYPETHGHCWCRKDLTDDKEFHDEFCQRTRALMEKMEVK